MSCEWGPAYGICGFGAGREILHSLSGQSGGSIGGTGDEGHWCSKSQTGSGSVGGRFGWGRVPSFRTD